MKLSATGRLALMVTAAVLGGMIARAYGEIKPDEVLIVANGSVPDSLRLAKLYAAGREIPAERILGLPCPFREQISREQYENGIATPIRAFIEQQDLSNRLKVIVTVYGVPLKVAGVKPTFAQQQLADELTPRYQQAFGVVERILVEINALAGLEQNVPESQPGVRRPAQFAQDMYKLRKHFIQAGTAMQRSIQAETDPQVRQEMTVQALNLKVRFTGLGELAQQGQVNKEAAAAIEQMQVRLAEMARQDPGERDLNEYYGLAEKTGGLLLVLQLLHDDITRLSMAESAAAVDDELTLVMHRDYTVASRVPNLLNPHLAENTTAQAWQPVFMTARLDGPMPDVVERMIADALAVEQTGLEGKIYLDARGIRNKDGYHEYDEDLRRLAARLKEQTDWPVVLDDRPAVFEPNCCDQAALYCGWYSLRNYVPSFTFVRGAVAYHLASFEAQSLHDPKQNLWCPKLLAAGAAATIGPVDEPYLDSFPPPGEFIPLLLSGRYTLVEAFFMTKRYNSWRMILIGDPLYRPFAKNPCVLGPATQPVSTPSP
ncbi:MAG: TIGR03790 family protein [Phycisphaerae bacterium]|nr:TIGR03790 family protein [Phycisphaerae bacterium]